MNVGGVLQQRLDQGCIQLGLAGAKEQREADRVGAEHRWVNFMHVLEIYEDVVHWRRKVGGTGGHEGFWEWGVRWRWVGGGRIG